ncbi:hypothetical protein [uncultured Tenacibaculum sp.]|uniref:hypothetical protein n=1 Tax=uncultured Tenacibaculum sp. TaxID=174713 RepID=UPI002632D34C|nr:hypothetical protein [uncultured Tenacibaculum sp.]
MIRLGIFTIVLLMTLEVFSQSPKFSFSQEFIEVKTSENIQVIKVYKGSFTSHEQLANKEAILGDLFKDESSLSFTPVLPFQLNTTYTAIVNDSFFEFLIPLKTDYKKLSIAAIYPNTLKLPSNFLKWYVAFSKPVNPANIYNHIMLINTKTKEKVDRALLPLENALLSNDGKLLTLWIEPGRQKRDLGPNKHLGEVLNEGASYTLLIDEKLKDTDGVAMGKTFEHSFRVVGSDRIQPSIKKWEFVLPKSNTNESLVIQLNDNLDFGSLHNSLEIINKKGQVILGSFNIKTNESTIAFTPNTSWKKGDYILKCDKIIEDVSGNNLERLFDRDITKKKTKPILERKFSISK